jgi:hypothetical protein
MDNQPSSFDPLAIVRTLNGHGVHYVLIGGIAAGVQGAMWATFDLDVVYERSAANHEVLADALSDLDAVPVDLPAGVAVTLDRRALDSGDVWTLMTRWGRLDLMGEPAPGLRYAELISRARWIDGTERYPVASIEDLIAMKSYAGRPKDLGQVELLRAVGNEIAVE